MSRWAPTSWNTLTPYIGRGNDLILARETAPAAELVPTPHAFVGLEVAFWHVAFGVEGQYSVLPTAQAQLSVVF